MQCQPWTRFQYFIYFHVCVSQASHELQVTTSTAFNRTNLPPVFLFSAGHLEPHVLPAVVLRPDARRSGARYHGGAVRHDGPDCEHDERHSAGPPDGAFDHGQPDGGGNEADGGVHQRVHDAVNTQDHELDGRHR
jgi:hypothetical protein